MKSKTRFRALIVGAGAMGVMTGFHLSLAGAEITFLVRPHRQDSLDRSQLLYCFDDERLKEYTNYTYVTDPSNISDATYDYIIITLDGAALRNEVGQSLTKKIGEVARQSEAKVILGSVFFNIRPWFLEASGLSQDKVVTGALGTLVYSTKAVQLPVHPSTDRDLLQKSDYAYTDALGSGFVVDDSCPTAAKAFMDAYNRCEVSKCVLMPASGLALFANPLFASFSGFQLLGWPNCRDIDTSSETWKLTTLAVREIQALDIHGEAGQKAAEETNELTLAELWAAYEKQALPLDFQGFNRYHHGGKVVEQDRQILQACIEQGNREGKTMSALVELLQRVWKQ